MFSLIFLNSFRLFQNLLVSFVVYLVVAALAFAARIVRSQGVAALVGLLSISLGMVACFTHVLGAMWLGQVLACEIA